MAARPLADAVVLQGESHRGGGNRLYLFGEGAEARVLKVYRRRRDAWRAPFRALGSYMEGKRGTSAQARFETERAALALWARHGFDVPRVFDEPLPEGVAPPALWMERCPGPTLLARIRARRRSTEEAAALVRRFTASLARRHAVAHAEDEVLLVHEHPAFNHVIVGDERLVSFDLEGGYRPGFPVSVAIETELAGLARTLLRARAPDEEALLAAFVAGYGEALAARVESALTRRGPRAWATRTRGRIRRRFLGKRTKHEALQRLRDAAGAPAP